MPYFRNSIAYDHYFWYTCVNWCYLVVFSFIIIISFFSKLRFFRLLMGKKAKMAQNNQKKSVCCPSYLRNHTSWFSFMVLMRKRIISHEVFFIFSKFWFSRLLGRKRAKNSPKNLKSSTWCPQYPRNHTSYDLHLWYTCVKG